MKELTKKQKENLELSKQVIVNTFTGKSSLYDLCENIGVKEKVVYYNMVEVLKPKSIRTLTDPFHVVKKIHNRGFVFNDGFEIKHVENKYFVLWDAPIREVRERSR